MSLHVLNTEKKSWWIVSAAVCMLYIVDATKKYCEVITQHAIGLEAPYRCGGYKCFDRTGMPQDEKGADGVVVPVVAPVALSRPSRKNTRQGGRLS